MASTNSSTTVTSKPAVQTDSKPTAKRFEHPTANCVLVLTPFDTFWHEEVKRTFEDELSYLETPPKFVQEIPKEHLVPSTIIYIAHPTKTREKQPNGQFKHVTKIHISEPFDVVKFYGLSKQNRGLDIDALQTHIMHNCIARSEDAKNWFWLVRRTNDGGLKIFDN